MIEEWFATPIFFTDLKDYNDKNKILAKRAYDLRNLNDSVETQWHCDTFNTLNKHFLLGNSDDQTIIDFIEYVGSFVYEFAECFGVNNKKYQLVCKDFWFNIASPGDYQEFHQHPNNHFSAVYYVQSEPNCGNIVFKNPESIGDMFQIPNEVDTRLSYKTVKYEPNNSRLLIFKSNLMHMVEKNKSNSDRISIALNFYLEEVNNENYR